MSIVRDSSKAIHDGVFRSEFLINIYIYILTGTISLLPNLEIKNYFGKLEFLCRIRLSNSPLVFFAKFTANREDGILKNEPEGFLSKWAGMESVPAQ